MPHHRHPKHIIQRRRRRSTYVARRPWPQGGRLLVVGPDGMATESAPPGCLLAGELVAAPGRRPWRWRA